MNTVSLIGNLGNDPEVTVLPSGTPMANFRLAVNETYRKGSENVKKTVWVRIKVFGKRAETMGRYLSKGSKIGVRGKLALDEWESEGQKRSKLYIVADNIDFLPSRSGKSEAEPF